VNGDEEPTQSATWVALELVAAAIALTLILVFVIDMVGGH
jgi:hypothetical protein